MPEQFDSIYFSGQGPMFLGLYSDGLSGLVFYGDVSQIESPPNVSRTKIKENVSGQRLTGASFKNNTDYPINITMKSVKPEHLALAIGGDITAKAASSVTDEAITGRHDKFAKIANLGISNIVVTDSTGVTTYTAGTDYVVYAPEGMIEILSTGAITDGESLLIDYDYVAQHHVKANPKDEDLILFCPTINRANSGKRGRLTMYKINLDPSSLAAIIDGDTEAAMNLTGELLTDTSRAAGDQLYSWEMED